MNDSLSIGLSNSDFEKIGRLITTLTGIKINETKKPLIESRLRKRMSKLGLDNISEYINFLYNCGNNQEELIHFINIITTNKTDFFRENRHFDFLIENAIPELIQTGKITQAQKLKIWSAGCSTGEEPYSIAMLMNEYLKNMHDSFSILATDISTDVLEQAKTAIYNYDRLSDVPEYWKVNYFLRSKDRNLNKVRLVPAVRSRVTFKRVNFMDDNYQINDNFHVVFFRNVSIYFDRPTTEKIISKILKNVVTGGYLFTGHSESLYGFDLPLKQMQVSVFKKIE